MSARPARRAEWRSALARVFARLPDEVRAARVEIGLNLLRDGTLDPTGLFIGGGSAVLAQAFPGRTGQVWPPPAQAALLLPAAVAYLRERDVILAQAYLAPGEPDGGLVRHGFPYVTELWSFAADLTGDALPGEKWPAPDLHPADDTHFPAALFASYHGSLDCPEVNGLRTWADITASLPPWCCSVRVDGETAGVLALDPDRAGWVLSYLGVVPVWRGRGVGKSLCGAALREARTAGSAALSLAVDCRNEPARALYRQAGFQVTDLRRLYLWTATV